VTSEVGDQIKRDSLCVPYVFGPVLFFFLGLSYLGVVTSEVGDQIKRDSLCVPYVFGPVLFRVQGLGFRANNTQ
jgi:hypothetical protein